MKQAERDFKRADRRRKVVEQIKLEYGCKVCGYNKNPAALEFDHRDPTTKYRPVAGMMYRSMRAILEEIVKCDVLCANCHQVKSVAEHKARYEKVREPNV